MDSWYKEFGQGSIERYYKLLRQDDESFVELEEFAFDTVARKLADPAVVSMPFKQWVDKLAANAIHPVAESRVPFLFHF